LKYFKRLPGIIYVPLVVQGQEDKTVDWQYNMPVVKEKFNSAKFFYIKNGRHQLVNESEEIRRLMFSAMDVYLGVYSRD
jgi:alpha-beta hydrolase superfamily lysophospholipase